MCKMAHPALTASLGRLGTAIILYHVAIGPHICRILMLLLGRLWNLSWGVGGYWNGPGQRPLCPAAKVGSTSRVLSSMPRLLSWRLIIALGHWLRAWLDMCWTLPRLPCHCIQTGLAVFGGHSLSVKEAIHQHLLSTRARALALLSALPHTGGWLNHVPFATLGLHLQDQEFWCCLCYWLGLPLHSSSYSFPECHNTADPFYNHQVGCRGNWDRITRQNAIWVFSAAQSAALAPSKEMPNLIPDSYSRPANVFFPTWSCGRPAALDVQVISLTAD